MSRLIGVLIVLGLGARAHASVCETTDKRTLERVEALIKDVERRAQRAPADLDDFLSRLPRELKRNFVFVTNSRSLQESTTEHPRVVLTSENADVTLSFGTGPGLRGYEAIEIIKWNSKKTKFEFVELKFTTAANASAGPEVFRNPPACVACHGTVGKPNWETGEFWPGVTPLGRLRDVVQKSRDHTTYVSLLSRIRDGESRLRHLEPRLGAEEFRAVALKDLDESMEQSDRLSRGFRRKNMCRLANAIESDIRYRSFAWVIIAALKQCGNLMEYVPKSVADRSSRYFRDRGIVVPGSGDSLSEVVSDTAKHQLRYTSEKTARVLEALREELGVQLASDELERIRLAKILADPQDPALGYLRYFLDPVGFATETWSPAIDPTSYSFGGASAAETLLEELQRAMSSETEQVTTMSCTNLKDRSLAALGSGETVSLVPLISPTSQQSQTPLIGTTASHVFSTRCVMCHLQRTFAAPLLPFNDLDRLAALMRTTDNLPDGGLRARIRSRVGRDPSSPGHMPLFGPALSADEQRLIEGYLEKR